MASATRLHEEEEEGEEGAAEGGAGAPPGLSIDEVLELIGFGPFQLRLQALSGLGYMADTAELLFVTFVIPEFQKQWPELSEGALALVPTVSAAGTLVGAPLWGAASDLLGRRGVFVGSVGVCALFGLLGAAAPTFGAFVATRFAVGVGLGGALAVDFVLFVEFVPAASRGRATMLLTLWGVLGVLYVGGCALLLLPAHGWRAYAAAAALPSAVLLCARARVPESPRSLLVRGHPAAAVRVLRAVAAANGRAHALPAALALARPPPAGGAASRARLLARAPLARRLATLSAVWLGLSCAYAGFTFWLPAFLAERGVGGLSVYQTYLLMTAAEVPGLLAATAALERLGRRAVLASALLGFGGSLCAFAGAASRAAVVGCSCAAYATVVGAWATLYTLTPESFPTAVRSSAAGATRLCACVGTMAAAPLGAALRRAGARAPVFAYAALVGGCALAALSLPNGGPRARGGAPAPLREVEPSARQRGQRAHGPARPARGGGAAGAGGGEACAATRRAACAAAGGTPAAAQQHECELAAAKGEGGFASAPGA